MAKSLLDELASVLGTADAIAKIKANPELADRIAKQDELYGYYKDETIEAPSTVVTPPAAVTPPAVVTPPATASGDMGALLRSMETLTAKIGDIPTLVKTQVDEAVKTRGDELVTAATTRALRQADELAKAREDWNRNYSDGGKVPFDSGAFETYVNEQTTAGNRFASVTKAYESFTAAKREDVTVENKVRERLKERNTGQVPGVTPTTAKSTLGVLLNRGREKDGNGETAVSRAGERLDARLRVGNE